MTTISFFISTLKQFAGNTDSHTVVSHVLDPPITARYVRFQALAWYQWAAMRVEVYGCHGNLLNS